MSYQHIVLRLVRGENVILHPSGGSMEPRIHSGQEITLVPCNGSDVTVGDVVLANVHGRYCIHLVSAVEGDRVQISNNHGHVNGWTNRNKIYGKVRDV